MNEGIYNISIPEGPYLNLLTVNSASTTCDVPTSPRDDTQNSNEVGISNKHSQSISTVRVPLTFNLMKAAHLKTPRVNHAEVVHESVTCPLML